MKYGKPGEIPPVEVTCKGDIFDNAIRAFGVENSCEWFGHSHHSQFAIDTVEALCERSNFPHPG